MFKNKYNDVGGAQLIRAHIKAGRRPSLLNDCLLSDGRQAWPVAQAAGISEATFRARLKAGSSPDDAATRPVPVRDADLIRRKRADRAARCLAYQAQRAADADMRCRSSLRAARLDALADVYGGVLWSDGDLRVIVSPRGAFYAAQSRVRGEWRAVRSFPSASALRVWLLMIAEAMGRPGLSDAVAGLPDDPASCDRVVYRRSASA